MSAENFRSRHYKYTKKSLSTHYITINYPYNKANYYFIGDGGGGSASSIGADV